MQENKQTPRPLALDQNVLLVFHGFVSPKVGLIDIADKLMERVIAPHDNVCMVFCGHYDGTGYVRSIVTNPETGANHTVHSMLFNYRKWSLNSAHMRTLYFDPIRRTVTVTTINPMSDKKWPDDHFGTTSYVIENAF